MKSQDPPIELLQPIVNLFTNGKLQQALSDTRQLLEKFPNSVILCNISGASNSGLMQFDDAIVSYKKALEIKPDHAEAYYNMGIALKDTGDLEAAIDSYKKVLEIKPDYAEVKENLLSLMMSYSPQKENSNLIVKVNEEIRKIKIKSNISKNISDDQVVNLFSRSEDCISSFGLNLETKLSQIFRRNSVNLNCKRHKSIFDKHDVIPEFCFGCYKVQIEPRSIIELIKLFIIFDQLELNENNTRKCMVELRPEVSGSYKGLIFCSGLKQANLISDHLNKIIKQSIGPGLSSSVKRGCSEYAISHPNYKEINQSGVQLMNFNKDWKVFEESYDKKKSINSKIIIRKSLCGLNLSDALIMRKWIDYAKGIGDPSADLLNQNTIHYQNVYDQARARLNSFDLTTF